MSTENGAAIICRVLERLGVEVVFGLPGTQNLQLFEALRCSPLRTIAPTHELAAAFMANGYARSSGRVGVLNTISGPGFAFSLAGLAEAFLDSAPLLHIVNKPAEVAGRKYNHQAIDQVRIADSIVKRIYDVDCLAELGGTVEQAYHDCLDGEPGPVLVQVADHVFFASDSNFDSSPAAEWVPEWRSAMPDPDIVCRVLERLSAAGRIVLYCGQGANNAAGAVRDLAELLDAPVVTTRSARGLIPETHPLSIVFNPDGGSIRALNRLFERCDLVLALGCKFSHNGSAGFRLRIPERKLVRVDASRAVLEANYPAEMRVWRSVEDFLDEILRHRAELGKRTPGWEPGELDRWRSQVPAESEKGLLEPKFHSIEQPAAQTFFSALREAMPERGCLVTDSGLHQVMARVRFRALSPRSFIVPSDFQSMGFGLPAAIGAALADPQRPVVALIGDGGLAMSGMELLTAVREKVPLTVIVFNDGALGQIRLQQITAFGAEYGTSLMNPDFELFAESVGASFFRLEGDARQVLERAIRSGTVSLVEVVLGDSKQHHIRRIGGLARRTAKKVTHPIRHRLFRKILRQ